MYYTNETTHSQIRGASIMKNKEKANLLKDDYLNWKLNNFESKTGFYPVFSNFKEHMKTLSPGAITLFIYLGLHSNNQTGESFHSLETMAKNLNKSTRTISSWANELEESGLIVRLQLSFNSFSTTFIRPY